MIGNISTLTREQVTAPLEQEANRDADDSSNAEVDEQSTPSETGPESPPNDEQPENETEEETSEQLSLDVVFEIAKNERRRHVLRFLKDREDPVSLSDLAEHVAAQENDKPVSALSSGERKRVYVGLYQCHLPKMDDANVINFDRNPGITLSENADQFDKYLNVDEEPARPWEIYYGALAGSGVLLFALAQLGSGALPWLPDAVMAVFLIAVGACAAVHNWTAREE